jgi:hypothetical protein
MMTTFMRIPALAACCACLMLAYGCGKDEKSVSTPQGELRITTKGDTSTVEMAGKDIKVTSSSGEGGVALPADFPRDMPVIKGGVVKMAMEAGPNFSVHLTAPASVAEAGKFYEDGLKAQGWKIEAAMNMGDSMMISASKGKRKCAVTVAKEAGGGSLLQLVVPRDAG